MDIEELRQLMAVAKIVNERGVDLNRLRRIAKEEESPTSLAQELGVSALVLLEFVYFCITAANAYDIVFAKLWEGLPCPLIHD